MTAPKRNASDRRLKLTELRAAYDAAFRDLVAETRRRQLAPRHSPCDRRAQADASARIGAAAAAVRRQRDLMADFLLSSRTGPGSGVGPPDRRPFRRG